ncbi:hypothetical protein QBC34DRAFT_379239 [Podospora aff. communis PSN243]|uniref:Uncharacterized protein n=1 Tax=Podospora aff. communis PSN243 TaxID=3040156 RepID=A0AAV9GSA7_9PEZI|nr:hypothetical protein QBC34DRAFT_379239 [Podospora aff. communis PSN243]
MSFITHPFMDVDPVADILPGQTCPLGMIHITSQRFLTGYEIRLVNEGPMLGYVCRACLRQHFPALLSLNPPPCDCGPGHRDPIVMFQVYAHFHLLADPNTIVARRLVLNVSNTRNNGTCMRWIPILPGMVPNQQPTLLTPAAALPHPQQLLPGLPTFNAPPAGNMPPGHTINPPPNQPPTPTPPNPNLAAQSPAKDSFSDSDQWIVPELSPERRRKKLHDAKLRALTRWQRLQSGASVADHDAEPQAEEEQKSMDCEVLSDEVELGICGGEVKAEGEALYFIDSYQYAYDVSCYKSKQDGRFCDLYLGETRSQLKQPDPCSDCVLGPLAVRLSSPVGYSDELAAEFSSATARCSATGYTYSRTSYSFAASTTGPFSDPRRPGWASTTSVTSATTTSRRDSVTSAATSVTSTSAPAATTQSVAPTRLVLTLGAAQILGWTVGWLVMFVC